MLIDLHLQTTNEEVFCRWSKGEQSTALQTATDSSLQVCMLQFGLYAILQVK